MGRALAILALVIAAGGVGRAAPSPEPAASACRIYGEVLLDGRPVVATVDVRLRLHNPRHPHGFHWTSEARDRLLLAPRLEEAPVATIRSDAEGQFDASGLAPGRYWVLARAETGAWAGLHVPLHVQGQHERVTLDLQAGTERLAGRLVGKDGKPLRGFVGAGPTPDLGPDRDEVRFATYRWVATDTEGRFAIDGLPRGETHVTVLWPGRLRQPMDTLLLPHAGEYEATVGAVEAPIAGRITDIETDEPVEGASVVWIAYTMVGPACGIETTAADGTYSLPSALHIDSIHVRKQGYAERYLDRLESVGRGTTRIRRGVRITGRVVTTDGGSAGAGILVERRGPGSYWYQWTHAATDAEGRFAFEDEAPGDGTIYARGNGWVPQGLTARGPFDDRDELPRAEPFRWLVRAGSGLDLTLTVERGAAIHGRVVDHGDRPMPGVPLIVEDSEDPAYSWDGHGVPPVAASGLDGTFRIDGLLAEGEYKLSARPPGGAPIEAKTVAYPRGIAAEPLVLRLPQPHWVLVRVVDAKTGQPVVGARVQLMRDRLDDRTWRTDGKGVARVGPVGPAGGDVDIQARGYIDANQRPVPVATREGAEVTIAIHPALRIEGRVTWEDGSPASEAIVYVANLGDDIWRTYRGKTACDPMGRFVAAQVYDGELYRVAAVAWRGKERFAATLVRPGGARDVLLELEAAPDPAPAPAPTLGPAEERPVVARLRVVDPRGRPVPRARVTGGNATSEVKDGEIRFERPPDLTTHPMRISHATAEDGAPLPVGPLRLDAWPADAGDPPVVTLPPERVIEGRVAGPDGRPVRRVDVAALDRGEGSDSPWEEGSPFGMEAGAAVCGPDGTFRIGGLEDRTYGLRFVAPSGFFPPLDQVTARPGARTDVRLRKALTATMLVTDPDGRAVEGAALKVTRPGWRYFWRTGWMRLWMTAEEARTDAAGRAVLTNLDPERSYGLEAAPPKGRDDLLRETRERWIPADTTLALPPRGVLRGLILNAGGGPWSSNQILWRQGGEWRSQEISGNEFTLEIPARGVVELVASVRGLRQPLPSSHIVKAQTGALGVELPYTVGGRLRVRVRQGKPEENDIPDYVLVEEGTSREAPRAMHLPVPEHREGDGSTASLLFEGLDPAATYTLVAAGLPGGKCVHHTGIKAREEPLDLEAVPGASIEGVLRVPLAGPLWSVGVGAVGVHGGPRPGGDLTRSEGQYRFRIDGLPPGRWRVQAAAIHGDEEYAAEAEADTGGTVTLELQRADPPAPR
jgi:hypothetical protein